ncbi:MAG: acetyl-CoA carboxylase carboxyltransferase subunit alpha [Armatimonadetes bacterium]|nr:acetyl-CoA carboxylase carboxyltransferase subunit alpha [Armatimonadota bacterium]
MKNNPELETRLAQVDERLAELRRSPDGTPAQAEELERLQQESDEIATALYSDLEPWDHVSIARHDRRPYSLDYIELLFTDFVELHGDRRYGDDGAIVAGLARFNGRPVAIIGQQKGRTAAERKQRNFGMARPEGYRKAMRIMQLAAKMGRPIITFVDTPGADCLDDSESRGISEAIATNQRDMFALPVPVLTAILGEGGSGGAIGLGVGNRVLMLEHAYYSVIAPESCAAILWRSAEKRKEAAAALKLTSADALALGIVDEVVPEPPGGAHRNAAAAATALRTSLEQNLAHLVQFSGEVLMEARYEKFRTMGGPEAPRQRHH